MRTPTFPLALVLPLVATTAAAQQTHSLIVSPDNTFILANNAGGLALRTVDDQESVITTPDAQKPYQARPLRTFTTINVMHGDGDGNGRLADTDRYGDCQCLMVRRRPPHAETGPFHPGNLWMSHSFNTTAAVATTGGIVSLRDGDVYRARGGKVEFFVRETVLANGFPAPAPNFDIDGMIQLPDGSLLFSLWASVTAGNTTYLDGDLYYVDKSAITYDANGFITKVAPNSVQKFAAESDISMIATKAALRDLNGNVITRIFDLAAIDLDPRGGTWTSPVTSTLKAPHILFASNTTRHFDNIWSTRGGGSAAVINGRTMGYKSGKADGSVLGIGLLPSGQDAVNAFVVVPRQNEWITMDSPLAGQVSQGKFVIEIGRVKPGSQFFLLVSAWPGQKVGGWVPGVPLPPLFKGNKLLELQPPVFQLAVVKADAKGYASVTVQDPGTVAPGTELLLQGAGTPFGATQLGVSATSSITF